MFSEHTMIVTLFLSLLFCNVQGENVAPEYLYDADFENIANSNYTSSWYCDGCSMTVSSDAFQGNQSIHITNRTQRAQGLAQRVHLMMEYHYKVTARVKLLNTKNSAMYQAVELVLRCKDSHNFDTEIRFGVTPYVQPGVWYEIGGVNQVLYGSKNCYVLVKTDAPANYLIDSASMTMLLEDSDWKVKAEQRIEQIRKADITIRLTGAGAKSGAVDIELIQTRHEFPFGSAVSAVNIVAKDHQEYQRVFYENFEWAVLENAFKWQQMESKKGQIDYSTPLTAVKALRSHGVKVRGHCISWGRSYFIQQWLKQMSPTEIKSAINTRIQGVLQAANGTCEQWDVNNENLHGDWFEKATRNPNVTMEMFKMAHSVDNKTEFYMNDFGLINYPEMAVAYKDTALKYKAAGVPISGLGVQSHFKVFDRLAVQTQLDIMAEAGLPIMITELSMNDGDANRKADKLEAALYTMFSHPSVKGILFWGFWDGQIFLAETALFNGPNITANAAGRMYQNLFHKVWRTNVKQTVQGDQTLAIRGFKGSYTINVKENNRTVISEEFHLTHNGQSLEIHLNATSAGRPAVSHIVVG